LIRTLCDLAADLDQRRILQVDTHARNSRQFRTQIFDDCFDIFLSLVHWLQDDQNVPGVAGGADVAKADGREDTDYIRILANEIDDSYQEIESLHGREGARLAAESHTEAIKRIEQAACARKRPAAKRSGSAAVS